MEDFAIKVDNVSKVFKLPHEKNTSIKSSVINLFRTHKKGYEIQHALKNVSFKIEKGEFFGIVGRNGSGKSTLLKLMAGIYTPTKGQVHINGKLTPFIELGVGFNPELTGRENVFLNGSLLGFNRKEMNTMYKDIVEFAELERFMDQKLKNYSSGMQVRLAFSIAIRAESDILLIDEVLAVGDAAFQKKCFDYFEEAKLKNRTVVFVSHDMNAIKRFCTRAIYMKEGKVVSEDTPAGISDMYAEENIETLSSEDTSFSSTHQINIGISKNANGGLHLKIVYKSKTTEPMYVGISVLRNGISVAEISTMNQVKITGTGRIGYRLDTSIFNGGTYQVGAGLFKLRNRELLAATKKRAEFVVKGHDPTKGAALKLPENWEP